MSAGQGFAAIRTSSEHEIWIFLCFEKAEGLSPELQGALEPLLAGIESLSARIRECNQRIEKLAQESYPQVALLKQIKGVGTLIGLTFLLTIDPPSHRLS